MCHLLCSVVLERVPNLADVIGHVNTPLTSFSKIITVVLMEVSAQVKRLIKEAGGLRTLAKKRRVSRQTLYNLLAGGWATKRTVDKLGIKVK